MGTNVGSSAAPPAAFWEKGAHFFVVKHTSFQVFWRARVEIFLGEVYYNGVGIAHGATRSPRGGRNMALSGGPSADWMLGDSVADEDIEPWQRVMRENAKKAKTERFIELLRVSPLVGFGQSTCWETQIQFR